MKKEQIFASAENILEKICYNLSKFGNVSDEEWSTCLFKYLYQWGKKDLAYKVWCRKEFGGDQEYFYLDMLWLWQSTDPYMKVYDVAFENENSDSWKNVLNDEVQKLIFIRANLKVPIYYIAEKNVDTFMDRVKWHIRGSSPHVPEESYLIILLMSKKRAAV